MSSTTRLFVGNLPENASENDIQFAFSSYGNITNIDIKCKPDVENDKKRFAFVTLSTSENCIESCLKRFSNEDFHGKRLYVTRARESFLERLQRERAQAQGLKKEHGAPVQNDFFKRKDDVFDHNRQNKRKILNDNDLVHDTNLQHTKILKTDKFEKNDFKQNQSNNNACNIIDKPGDKKQESEKKRLESMKRKRQEFKEKKMIIKTGLTGIDKVSNKKIIFSDTGEDNISENRPNYINNTSQKKNDLFDEEDSDDGINFNVKEQFEGKKGQKVLDLQSRYKSDKRFTLDERFAEDSDEGDGILSEKQGAEDETVELEQADEKSKQVKILQDVLGVAIRSKPQESSGKTKAKLGMLRFDPLQPDHAKFLAPVEPKEEVTRKSKKKKSKEKEEIIEPQPVVEVEKIEVSKEQFYEVSEVLKEAIAQPTSFSLRSLFSKSETSEEATPHNINQSIPLVKAKDKKVKNPLDPGEKNPFMYDSSESEEEEEALNKDTVTIEPQKIKPKAVWRENLFLSHFDNRLKEGLEFFNQALEGEVPKERRQLKSVMKKRLYNKERKNKMFQKKIGGRKKTMKKSYNKKS